MPSTSASPSSSGLLDFITSSPLLAMVLEGERAIELARQTMGATDPGKAAPGSIRADFGLSVGMNLVHGSDGPESAAREVSLWFDGSELIDYQLATEQWLIES